MKIFDLYDTDGAIEYPYATIAEETIENAARSLNAEIIKYYPETEEVYETAIIRIQKTDVPSLGIAPLMDLLRSCSPSDLYIHDLVLYDVTHVPPSPPS
ncbi:MAG: hypothetical protein Q8R30_00780 [bacterium]|nr:hypothetical protein [bacterium]MDZ4285584.1 hypothetical protein [Candidatus Sungbacteria bacterium]